MTQPSEPLKALLASLRNAVHGGTLVLDERALAGPGGTALIGLFSRELHVPSLTLDSPQLPDSVDGTTLAARGTIGPSSDRGAAVAVDLVFTDSRGEISAEALFRAPSAEPLLAAFRALPAGFFGGIAVTGTTAKVTVPGLGPLTLASPRYGVAGRATPNAGFMITSVAPRVDGQATVAGATREMAVQVASGSGGYRVLPLDSPWTFKDLDTLLGFGVLSSFPGIISNPAENLRLRGFELRLYPDAPPLSAVSLDIEDKAGPATPLWTAANKKVQLTNVTVTLGLTYSGKTLTLTEAGSVRGDFLLGTVALTAQIPFPLTGRWSLTAFPDVTLDVLNDIGTLLPASASFKDVLPPRLAALGAFEFSYLNIIVDTSGGFSLLEFTIGIQTPTPWRLIPDVIELESLRLVLTINGKAELSGMIAGTLRVGEGASASEILVSFGRNSPQEDWRLDVISPAVALPGLASLAKLAPGANLGSLVKTGGLDRLPHFVMTNLNFGLTFPSAKPASPGTAAAFPSPKLTNLGLTLQLADTTNADSPLTPLDWEIIPGVLTLTQFSFGFQVEWGATTTSKTAFGTFVVNGLEFDVRFAAEGTAGASVSGLIGEYSPQGPVRPVNFKDLVNSIAPKVAQHLPDGLKIDLADAALGYLEGADRKKKFVFAMDIGVEMPISDLPLVGKALPADALVGIKNLKVVAASEPMSAQDVAFVNSMSAKPVLPTPGAGSSASAGPDGTVIPQGFSMVAELQLGGLTVLMTSPPARPQSKQPALRPATAPAAAPDPAPATDPVMWLPVQKTFGPVQIQKIGFSYQGGNLFVVSNLGLSVAGLEIDLLGIGIGSPISKPALEFTIQGLAVSLTEGPVSIMGGMLGRLEPLDFTGVLSVHAPEFSLSAFAGYAQYEGHPSFFLYGVLDAPIGGPPAFFVTGIAAGVGFNRKLVIPDVSGVATFPLIQWAQGIGAPSMDPALPVRDQVGKALARLAQSGVVAPSTGDYWLAAGVRFTSFELIETFALLTVTLGTHVEIALLGLSTLTMPPDDPSPVAQVQLAIEVAFSPDKGLLAIAGQLTSNSYVLSREAQLTGGFAFYLWFTGEHAGEVVLTLGGYNPGFTVPGYYPAVPRVGLNWQAGTELKITGELYFALTSNVAMAGGKLSAVWNGGPVSAWFTYWADFLMTFTPFHYYVDGGIDLGASFTVDLKFVSISVTVHVGVTVDLWGPPFACRATVNLSVISFTILYNDHKPSPATSVPWHQFVAQLLPAAPAGRRDRASAAPGGPAPATAAVQINVTSGLVRELAPDADGPVYLVTAETFQCAVLTVIPSKSAGLAPDPLQPDPDDKERKFANLRYAPDDEQPKDAGGHVITPATDFGAGPAGLAPADFNPALTLTLSAAATSVLRAYRRLGNAPKALWEHKSFDAGHGTPQVDPATGLTQPTIPNALTGLTLIPFQDRADWTRPVPLDSLLSGRDGQRPFAWSRGVPPSSDPFTGQTVAGTIAGPAVAAVRGALLAALAGQGVAVNPALDVSRLASTATTDLQAAPRLRLLGEARQEGTA